MRQYLIILILLLGLATHIFFAHFAVLYEPDNYIYLSVANQTIANNLAIPATDIYSHFPSHLAYGEYPGLIYLAVIPALLGFHLFDILMYLPVLFTLLSILGIYLFTKEAFNQKIALYAALLMAILPAAIYRGMAGEWRGGVFVATIVIYMLYVMLKTKKMTKNPLKSYILMLLSTIPFIAISIWIWSGAYYVLAIALFAFIAMLITEYRQRNAPILLILAMLAMFPALFLSPYGTFFNYNLGITELQPLTLINAIFQFSIVLPLGLLGLILSILFIWKERSVDKTMLMPFCLLIAALAITLPLAIGSIRFEILMAAPICILAAYALLAISKATWINLLIIFASLSVFTFFAMTISPATVTPQLISSMNWIRIHTPKNATFLTSWPDGSLIESIGQRQSWSDSIQGLSYGQSFGRFLYARSGNFTYLENISPNYILVQSNFLNQTAAFASEANISSPTINGSNIQALLNNSYNNSFFKDIYSQNGIIIFRVIK